MVRYILFCHPLHADTKRAQRLLKRHKVNFRISDVRANGISSYIMKDMGIYELPALCIVSGSKYEIYEGIEEIQDFLLRSR
jgi:hypothetical protein